MNRSKVFWYLFIFFIFTIPISQYWSTRILVFLSLFVFLVAHPRVVYTNLKVFSWASISFLIVISIGLVYSEDMSSGIRVVETSSSLLLVPIIFAGITSFSKQHLYTIFLSFSLGLIVACLACLVNAAIQYADAHSLSVFFFYDLTEVLNSQPTYMAYYLCFSIGFLLYLLYYEELEISTWALTLSISFLFVMLMLTAGRTTYISMILVLSFFILKYLFEEQQTRSKTLAFLLTIFMLVLMLVVNHFDLNISGQSTDGQSDYWERLTLWNAAIEANPSILTGVGTGDYKHVLNQYYLSHHLETYANENFNSHNQFIQVLLSNGIIGIFSLFLLLGRPLYLSIQYNQTLGILIFFPFFIYGMTEVFLGRYQGVVFFALLNQSFIVYCSQLPKLPQKEF